MPDPKSLPPPETVAAIRTIFFARLAEINRDLNQALAEFTLKIDERNDNGCLGLLVYIENRIQAMHNILLVFREHFGG